MQSESETPFRGIKTLPYGETVLILWSDGIIRCDFWYDEELEDWLSARRRKPFHDDDPAVVPTHWMPEPPLPSEYR